VDPGFGRRGRPPPLPGLEGLDERVLGAILGFGRVAEDDDQRPVDARIRAPIEAVEILPRTRLVGLLADVRRRLLSGYSDEEY